MNQIKKFHIQLPLLIGKNQLDSHKLQQSLSSNQFKFKIDISQSNILHLNRSKQQPTIQCSCKLFQNEVHVFDYQPKAQKFQISITKSKKSTKFNYSYEIGIFENINDFNLCIKQQKLSFNLTKIESVKFIKNQLLTKLLQNGLNEYQSGLLTKDQLDRFLLLNNQSTFASIGIWQRSELPLKHPKTYEVIASYLKKQSGQKCKFKLNQKDFIYFVRVSSSKKTPEVYLVNWQQGSISEHIVIIPRKKNQIHISYPTFIDRSSQNGYEFTLKNPQSQTLSLQSAFCQSYLSPIKHIENNAFDHSFSNGLNQFSPKFSTKAKKQTIQNQCFQLKQKVQEQQQQIQRLNALVKNLQSQLKYYKQKNSRVSTQCWSKGSINYSPLYSPKNLSPRIIKKLRQSDLRSHSFSVNKTSQKKIVFQRLKFQQKFDGSSIQNEEKDKNILSPIQKRGNKQDLTSIKQTQNQPWQLFELVQ